MNREITSFEQKPFLKWAGGKRWFVYNYPDIFPLKYKTYIEPFLGSAAVFFHLKPKNAILADNNSELIDTYLAIRNNYVLIEEHLKRHHRLHCSDYYYKVRASRPRTPHTKAARFIYLNRTCWNGLYRVNLSGVFNVPKGTKDKVFIDADDFAGIAKLLRRCKLHKNDFQKTIEKAKRNDFLFIDPPYTVKHDNNGFVKYNENLFKWEDQIRLRDCVIEAADRGVQVLMTNADHKSVRKLYRGYFEIRPAYRKSVLSGDAKYRGGVKELIITNII